MNNSTLNTPESPVQQLRTIFWETNFNNKLACNAFVHIDLAPSQLVPRKKLEQTIIEIYTSDKSHPPVKTFVHDMIIIPYQKVSEYLCFASHGLTDMEMADWMFKRYHPDFSWTTRVAVYFYKKLKMEIKVE